MTVLQAYAIKAELVALGLVDTVVVVVKEEDLLVVLDRALERGAEADVGQGPESLIGHRFLAT